MPSSKHGFQTGDMITAGERLRLGGLRHAYVRVYAVEDYGRAYVVFVVLLRCLEPPSRARQNRQLWANTAPS